MTTSVTTAYEPFSVTIPPHLVETIFFDLDIIQRRAYCRLRYRCEHSLKGTFEASEAELARIGVDYSVLYQLRTKNLIRWAIKDDVQQIQMVER